MNILSIDYDYFFDCRQSLVYPFITEAYWISEYIRLKNEFPQNMKFNYEAFTQLRTYLSRQKVPVCISEDHSHIYHYLRQYPGINLRIVNVDQHHDLDSLSGVGISDVSSGSWVRALALSRAVDYTWVTNPWCIPQYSEKHAHELKNIRVRITSETISNFLTETYDLIFLIQSYEYSPSHMQHRFAELVDACRHPMVDDMFPLRYETFLSERENLKERDTFHSVELCDSPQHYAQSDADVKIRTYCNELDIWTVLGFDYDPAYLKPSTGLLTSVFGNYK